MVVERELDRLEFLYGLEQALSHAGSVDDVCAHALRGLEQCTGADRAAILIYDADGVMRFRAWHSLSDRYRAAAEQGMPWSLSPGDARPILRSDLSVQGVGRLTPTVLAEGILALACIPLVGMDSLLGRFMLYYDTPHEFSDEEVWLGKTIAGQVGAAVQRLRTEETLRQLVEQQNELRSAAEAAKADMAFLAEAGATLAGSLQYEETLKCIAEFAIPRLADWCTVHLFDEQGNPSRIGAAHADPSKQPLVEEMMHRFPPDPNAKRGTATVLRTGEPQIRRDLSDESMREYHRSYEHFQLVRQLGLRSAMLVPLIARGRILGTLNLMRGPSQPQYDDADLALAQALASRAALAADNARLYHEAREAVQLREQMLSIVSHDLKNPLTLVKGFTYAVKRQIAAMAAAPAEIATSLAEIEVAADRMNRMIDDLLDVSRLHKGRLELRPEQVDLAAIAREVVARFEHSPERTPRHTISVEALDAVVGVWDRGRLDQVMTNLLSNAFKYSPSGGKIRVVVVEDNDAALLVVEDQGIGMGEADKAALYQQFVRGENSKGTAGGMGLGFYIALQLVELHGGAVEVDSEPGRGTKVTVRLPRPLVVHNTTHS